MGDVGFLIIFPAIAFIVFFILIVRFLMKSFNSLKKNRLSRLEKDGILTTANTIYVDENASFFGIKSSGLKTMRGNGILILNKKEIYFSLFLPDKVYRIPLDKINNVRFDKSFLGKTRFKNLLVLDFTENDGTLNAAAWSISNLDEIAGYIKELIDTPDR